MGAKYRGYTPDRGPSIKPYQRVHPVWRGVGFAMMVLIPIISWAAADVLIQQNNKHRWFQLPVDLFAKPGEFLYRLVPDELLYIRLMFFVAFLLIFFAVFFLVSFIANSMFGITDRTDPFYVPPVRRTTRRLKK